MTFENDLVESLREDTTIAGIVGDRIHPVRAPWQNVFPYITYQISSTNVRTLCSTYNVTRFDVTFDVWGKLYTEAGDVRRALLAILQGNTDDPRFRVKSLTGSSDGYEDDTKVFRLSVTAIYWYNET